MTTDFVRVTDYDLEEPLTLEMIAETTGARLSLIVRLVEAGILETVNEPRAAHEPLLLPRRAILQLRQMQRLRRDLGVNFAGAGVIIQLIERIEKMRRELAETQSRFGKQNS